MDIVVTIPKKELKTIHDEDEFIKEEGGKWYQFWHVARQPKKLKQGDRVYFIENGMIRYYHKFLGYDEDMTCQFTDRAWEGLNLLLEYPEIPLKTPIPMKGFQGFRYMERTHGE